MHLEPDNCLSLLNAFVLLSYLGCGRLFNLIKQVT